MSTTTTPTIAIILRTNNYKYINLFLHHYIDKLNVDKVIILDDSLQNNGISMIQTTIDEKYNHNIYLHYSPFNEDGKKSNMVPYIKQYYKMFDFIGIFDDDEYLIIPQNTTLQQLLTKCVNYASIIIPWYTIGCEEKYHIDDKDYFNNYNIIEQHIKSPRIIANIYTIKSIYNTHHTKTIEYISNDNIHATHSWFQDINNKFSCTLMGDAIKSIDNKKPTPYLLHTITRTLYDYMDFKLLRRIKNQTNFTAYDNTVHNYYTRMYWFAFNNFNIDFFATYEHICNQNNINPNTLFSKFIPYDVFKKNIINLYQKYPQIHLHKLADVCIVVDTLTDTIIDILNKTYRTVQLITYNVSNIHRTLNKNILLCVVKNFSEAISISICEYIHVIYDVSDISDLAIDNYEWYYIRNHYNTPNTPIVANNTITWTYNKLYNLTSIKQLKELAFNQRIHIAYNLDCNRIDQALMSIKSVLKYNPTANINIITEKYIPELCEYNQLIMNISQIKLRESESTNGKITRAAYLRLYYTQLPYDKIIHLDADTLCYGSLDELWNMDVEYIRAWEIVSEYDNLAKIYNISKHVNSGVMLMNLKKLREDNFTEKCLSYMNTDILPFFHDETCINLAYHDKIQPLDKKYNFWRYMHKHSTIPNDIKICHYTGKDKSQMYKDYNKFINNTSPVICYCVDSNYTHLIKKSINSVLRYNPNAYIAIVCEKEISELLQYEQHIITLPKNLRLPKTENGNITQSTYLKLYYTQLPYDKIIHLDADTLCYGSLDELWNMDVEYINAVETPSPNNWYNMSKEWNISKHFNAGVMLMNLKKLREDNFTEKCLSYMYTDTGKWFFHDETCINLAYHDKVQLIDDTWNFWKYMAGVKAEKNKKYNIIHYTGSNKAQLIIDDNIDTISQLFTI